MKKHHRGTEAQRRLNAGDGAEGSRGDGWHRTATSNNNRYSVSLFVISVSPVVKIKSSFALDGAASDHLQSTGYDLRNLTLQMSISEDR